MTTRPSHPEVERLLANARWLSRLAAHLVGQDAEDAIQETWRAVCRHRRRTALRGPHGGAELRP